MCFPVCLRALSQCFMDWAPGPGLIFHYDNFRHNTATEPGLPWQPPNVPFSPTANHLAVKIYDIPVQRLPQVSFRNHFDVKSYHSPLISLKHFNLNIDE